MRIEPSSGQLILTGGIDTKLSIYEVNKQARKRETAKLITKVREYSGHQGLVTTCGWLSPEYFVSGSNDSSVHLWEVEQARALHKYDDHQNEVLTMDVFPMDGNVFATGSSDLTFRVWDIRMKKACMRQFEKNKCGVSSIKFMPENVNTLAVGYEDASVKIWDLRAIWPVAKLIDKGYESVSSMNFSKSGRLLFSAYSTNVIKVWDLLTETRVGTFGDKDHKDVLRAISLSEDGGSLISCGKDGLINKWQMAAKK